MTNADDVRGKIGDMARIARMKKGLSRPKFAERAGVATNTVQDFEIGTRWPRPSTISKIETELGWRRGSLEGVWNRRDSMDPASITWDLFGDSEDRPLSLKDFTDEELLRELGARLATRHRTDND